MDYYKFSKQRKSYVFYKFLKLKKKFQKFNQIIDEYWIGWIKWFDKVDYYLYNANACPVKSCVFLSRLNLL